MLATPSSQIKSHTKVQLQQVGQVAKCVRMHILKPQAAESRRLRSQRLLQKLEACLADISAQSMLAKPRVDSPAAAASST